MNVPDRLQTADLLLVESTYGDREHRPEEDSYAQLRAILKETWQSGGSVMIPAFAVGRTQDILFHLGSLFDRGELDNWEIFLDSPMAIAVTRVYNHWLGAKAQPGVRPLSKKQKAAFTDFLSRINMALETEDSMAINRIKGGAIIIAGSGMCTGGRIRHHLEQRIGDSRNALLFTGYQARGTLGRLLVDGVKTVKIFGQSLSVKARIETLGGLSAHAGQRDLVQWISAFDPPPRTLLVHGESHAQRKLADRLREERSFAVEIPSRGATVTF